MDTDRYRTFAELKDIEKGVGCQDACPLHIDMPNYYALMERGRYEDAYILLKSMNPFPSITGRVCFFPCEYSCVRGMLDTPVSIREVEYFLSDYIQEKRPDLAVYKEGSKKGTRSESVAVIGSGPAGMTCAWDLAHLGYKVTMYEKAPLCGGMAHLGIPIFKMIREVIDFEFDVLRRLGVNIKNNVEVGKDITVKELLSNGFSAVCVAVGADLGRKLNIPGENESDNVYESTEILRNVRSGFREKFGDTIVVIGGGNTAMDTARTVRRLGSKDVTIISLESREDMPAYNYEIEDAEREGVNFLHQLKPVKIENRDGKATGLTCLKLGPYSSEMTESDNKNGSSLFIPAESIILSISQKPNLALLGDDLSSAVSEKGLVRQELETGIKTIPGLFAAGDAITGPRSIVSAFASGRRTAKNIDLYIRQHSPQAYMKPSVKRTKTAGVKGNFDDLKRQKSRKKRPLTITDNFDLLAEKFTKQEADEEAARCMRCNHSIEIDASGCVACNYCVEACPTDCLVMVTENNMTFDHESQLAEGEAGSAVMIRDALCIRCGACIEVCPPEVISFKSLASRCNKG